MHPETALFFSLAAQGLLTHSTHSDDCSSSRTQGWRDDVHSGWGTGRTGVLSAAEAEAEDMARGERALRQRSAQTTGAVSVSTMCRVPRCRAQNARCQTTSAAFASLSRCFQITCGRFDATPVRWEPGTEEQRAQAWDWTACERERERERFRTRRSGRAQHGERERASLRRRPLSLHWQRGESSSSTDPHLKTAPLHCAAMRLCTRCTHLLFELGDFRLRLPYAVTRCNPGACG